MLPHSQVCLSVIKLWSFWLVLRLTPEYDQVRIQILGKKKLPSLNEVFSMIRSEEHRRIAMLDESKIEGSAMISTKLVDTRNMPQNLPNQSKNSSYSRHQKKNQNLWCTYCKKPKHTKDTCFQLHGKEAVLSRMGGFKNLQPKNQANLTTKEPNETLEKVATTVFGV